MTFSRFESSQNSFSNRFDLRFQKWLQQCGCGHFYLPFIQFSDLVLKSNTQPSRYRAGFPVLVCSLTVRLQECQMSLRSAQQSSSWQRNLSLFNSQANSSNSKLSNLIANKESFTVILLCWCSPPKHFSDHIWCIKFCSEVRRFISESGCFTSDVFDTCHWLSNKWQCKIYDCELELKVNF